MKELKERIKAKKRAVKERFAEKKAKMKGARK